MTAKFLTKKGTYTHMSILRALIDNEVADHLEIKDRKQFYIATNFDVYIHFPGGPGTS